MGVFFFATAVSLGTEYNMKNTNREELLSKLELVQPGLATRETIEQSGCFVFRDGCVHTYNEEIACRMLCDIDLVGAVSAQPLLDILRKLTEETIEIGVDASKEGYLIIRGKRKEAGIVCESVVNLPIESVEKPEKWRPLPASFLEAINLVQHCASSDDSKFKLTCIHVHPKYLESCDNVQAMRVRLDTGFSKPVLMRRDSVKHLVLLGVVSVSETDSWVHFQTTSGLIFSCRRFVEDFYPLDKVFGVTGAKVVLPKGLSEASEKAAIFTRDDVGDKNMSVSLKRGHVRIEGTGAMGYYTERRKLKYSGPEMSFNIAPAMLTDISTKYREAEVATDKLIVRGGKWIYVSVLSTRKRVKPTPEQAS
jgi:hypothetical protein